MQPEISFDWSSVHVPASAVIALMRKHRDDGVAILFHYAEGIYHVGVNPANAREPFYMEEDTYPSMFAFCSSACIEGGFLLPDLSEKLDILSVNDADPAAYFEGF